MAEERVDRRDLLKFGALAAIGVIGVDVLTAFADEKPATTQNSPVKTSGNKGVKSPLFRDPMLDGATDPTLIFNRQTHEWWMFYTARRATAEGEGVAWVHGTDIGVASSKDGKSWLYRGVANGLNFEPGRNTYWAPEVIWHDGNYHMYVTYITGVPTAWVGDRRILHYTSKNLWDWEFKSVLTLSSNRVIDAGIYPLPNGDWRMWYKDEANHSHIYAADSSDLNKWTVKGPVLTNRGQEGPNVFRFFDTYWMVTDMWKGLAVYQSADLENWEAQDSPLLAAPGKRKDDGVEGHHPFLLAHGDDAYIFYFTHPDKNRRSSVQVAPLAIVDGKLTCDRDAEFELDMNAETVIQLRGGFAPA